MTIDRTHATYLLTTVLALTFTGIVAAQNKSLSEKIASARSGLLSGSAEALPGDLVPPFEATDLAGERATIAYSNAPVPTALKTRHRLFFIYSNACSVCLEQKAIWRSLLRDLSVYEESLDLIALHLPDAVSTLAPDIDLEPLLMPSLSIQRAYRVTAIPLMLLVSPTGEVQWVHYGFLGQDGRADLIDFIDSSLS